VGAAGRDFISMVFYSVVFVIPLMIPAMAALFPGTGAGWIRALPSYGLVQAILGVTAYGEGWADVWPDLAALAAWCAVAFAAGWVILSRKVESL